jgi:hypothetical protein
MELFSKYNEAALAQVAPGACIVLPYVFGAGNHETLVALKITRAEGRGEHEPFGPRSALIALWSSERSPFTPSLVPVEDAVEVIEISGAGAQLSCDPAHIHFGSVPVGALYLFGGEPHVRVDAPRIGLISVRLTDGARVETLERGAPWFPFWTVAVPDTRGRMETICSVNVRKPGP